ncbi:MAG: GGDEF domain-containing protein [Pseudomonadota bacterium]
MIALPRLIHRWIRLGVAPDDSDDLRLKKEVMTLVSSSIAFLAIFWSALYIVSGYALSGLIPLGYTVVSLASTLVFFRTRRFGLFCASQQLLILLLPFLLMWSLGGFANGSVVMIWAIFAPLAALFFIDLKAATRWMIAFMALLALSAAIDPLLAAQARPMPTGLNTLYFLMNLGCGFILIGLMLYYFVRDREVAYGKLLESEAHIRELMMTDPLTGVANRRHLDDRLAMELARQARYGQPLSVILTDIDWFKRVNDTFGHAAGDAVLEAFARTLEASIRSSDFLARYGGEEFVLLLPNTEIGEATALAERMREATHRIRIPDSVLSATASFGVTLARPGETMAEVLSRADEAMYLSKSGGRDRVTTLVD